MVASARNGRKAYRMFRQGDQHAGGDCAQNR
jgi:hypothetical protein